MDEVSCRAFTFFQEAERHGWISLQDLLVGSHVSLKQLSDPSQRVDWADWVYLSDRFADLVGYHRLQESAQFSMQPGFVGEVMSRVAPLIASPLQLYKTAFEWGGTSLYRCVSFSVIQTNRGIRACATLQPGYKPSKAWFEMLVGALRLLPTFMGEPPAVVQANATSSSVVALVTMEQRASLRLWSRRLFTAFVAPQNLFNELTFQQQQLLDTYQELSRRERSVFEMLSSLPASIVLFSAGRIVYANASFAEVVGLSISSLLDRELASLVVTEHQERLQQITSGERDLRPIQLLFKKGDKTRLLLASPLKEVIFEGEKVRGLFATDITEETIAKESLQHHEETLTAMSSTTPHLIARLDKDGVLLDIFGGEGTIPASATVALRGISLHLAPSAIPEATTEHIASLLGAIHKTLAEQRTQTIEISVAALVYECVFTPIQDREEVLVIAQNITQRREQERALAVSERMASLGTLVAGLGHEINNPLTYILGNQQLLLDDINRQLAGEEVDLLTMRELVQEATRGAERVQELVKGLRSFSRIEARPPGTTQLSAAIQEALRMVRNQLQHQAQIITELLEGEWVRGDHTQIVQVFVNLLVNALQSLDERRENLITLRTQRLGDKVAAIVEDSGQGIAAHNLSRIFDPFFTTKPAGQGTGLGLSIVHRIMEELGGSISAESEPDRGTKMTLTFAAAKQHPTSAPALNTPMPNQRRRVLIIDDEVAIGRTMSRILRDYDTVVCNSGEAALELLRRDHSFDAILCDINMPNLSGIDVYEAITQAEPSLVHRFLFMTGGAFTRRSQEFLEATRPMVFEKPGRMSEIIRQVEAIIARAKPQ